MKYILPALVGLFLCSWFLNYPVLSGMFDLESCSDQYRFWILRTVVYEFMFLSLALACFLLSRGLTKAFSCFAVILIAGNLVDKLVFNIPDYMYGDIVLVVLGIIASYLVWKRTR